MSVCLSFPWFHFIFLLNIFFIFFLSFVFFFLHLITVGLSFSFMFSQFLSHFTYKAQHVRACVRSRVRGACTVRAWKSSNILSNFLNKFAISWFIYFFIDLLAWVYGIEIWEPTLAVTAAAAAGAGALQLLLQAGGVRLLPVGHQADGLGLLLGDQATHPEGLEVLPPGPGSAATAQQ